LARHERLAVASRDDLRIADGSDLRRVLIGDLAAPYDANPDHCAFTSRA
jgi:hypothetical protein